LQKPVVQFNSYFGGKKEWQVRKNSVGSRLVVELAVLWIACLSKTILKRTIYAAFVRQRGLRT
jgi:hypothetical protein